MRGAFFKWVVRYLDFVSGGGWQPRVAGGRIVCSHRFSPRCSPQCSHRLSPPL